jgi:hypothetical protein
MAIMEIKLNQQLAWVDQAPLYQIYLDLKKAYDTLDRTRYLEILAGYGVGPNLLRLQKQFWGNAKMVCHAGGNFGEPFSTGWGVTQGGPLSGLMFNICVNAVVRDWLQQVLGDFSWECWRHVGDMLATCQNVNEFGNFCMQVLMWQLDP